MEHSRCKPSRQGALQLPALMLSRAGGLQPTQMTWCNILEERLSDEPEVTWRREGDRTLVDLNFRGFEVRSLHVVL